MPSLKNKIAKQDFLELVALNMGQNELHFFFDQIQNDGKNHNYFLEMDERKKFYKDLEHAQDPNLYKIDQKVKTPRVLYSGIIDAICIVSANQAIDENSHLSDDQIVTLMGQAKTIKEILAAASALESQKVQEKLQRDFIEYNTRGQETPPDKWIFKNSQDRYHELKQILPATFSQAKLDFLNFEEGIIAREIAVLERKNNIKVVYSFDSFREDFLHQDPIDVGDMSKNRGLTSEFGKIEDTIGLYLQVFKNARRIF